MSDQIYFGHMVSPQRAEFLAKMLDVPLCKSCGREADACDADPCIDNRAGVAGTEGTPRPPEPSHWDDDKEFPVSEWQAEIAADKTRQSYADWVAGQREQAREDYEDQVIDLFHDQWRGPGIDLNQNYELSEGDDNGCYVAAWLWVDFEGTELDIYPDDDGEEEADEIDT